jgi:hypothetical protein
MPYRSARSAASNSGGFGTINRVDQKRVVTLTADAEGRLSTGVLADVQRQLGPLGDPRLTPRDIRDWDTLTRTLRDARDGLESGLVSRIWKVLPRKDAVALAKALSGETSGGEGEGQILLRSLNLASC